MGEINIRVGACPTCGASIYVRRVTREQPPDVLMRAVYDEVLDGDGLPKNFFTCNCRLPKLVMAGSGEFELPEVDIDKVHEGEGVLSKERLEALKVEVSGSTERMYRKVAAMECLQGLLSSKRREDDPCLMIQIDWQPERSVQEGNVVKGVPMENWWLVYLVKHTANAGDVVVASAEGESLPETILNLKVEK